MKLKPVWTDINPKAVTTDELFGYMHPATREWKDGEDGGSCRKLIPVPVNYLILSTIFFSCSK